MPNPGITLLKFESSKISKNLNKQFDQQMCCDPFFCLGLFLIKKILLCLIATISTVQNVHSESSHIKLMTAAQGLAIAHLKVHNFDAK